MSRTLPAIDYTVISPNAEVYSPSGEHMGRVIEVSGDRFHISAGRQDAWVPNEWITAAHPHIVVVSFDATRLPEFRHAGPTRWRRRFA